MSAMNAMFTVIKFTWSLFETELLYLVDNSFNFSSRSSLSDLVRASVILCVMSLTLFFLEHIPCCCVIAELFVLTLVLRLCASTPNDPFCASHRGRVHLILSVVTGVAVCMIYRFFVVPFQHFHMMTTTFFLMMSMSYVACCFRFVNTLWHAIYSNAH